MSPFIDEEMSIVLSQLPGNSQKMVHDVLLRRRDVSYVSIHRRGGVDDVEPACWKDSKSLPERSLYYLRNPERTH